MTGSVKYKILSGGGIDEETGEPVESTGKWSKPIECKYRPNLLKNHGKSIDGDFTQSEYTILVNDMTFYANEIQLFNSKGILICQKQIQTLIELETVQRIQIII
jgi:hypothetical protein